PGGGGRLARWVLLAHQAAPQTGTALAKLRNTAGETTQTDAHATTPVIPRRPPTSSGNTLASASSDGVRLISGRLTPTAADPSWQAEVQALGHVILVGDTAVEDPVDVIGHVRRVQVLRSVLRSQPQDRRWIALVGRRQFAQTHFPHGGVLFHSHGSSSHARLDSPACIIGSGSRRCPQAVRQ